MASLIKILIIAIGLAMDALSVSIVTGVKTPKTTLHQALRIGLCFGAFQAAMPLIGYFIGNALSGTIDSVSGYVACILLVLVGAKMIYESFQKEKETPTDLSTKTLLGLGFATSIDALIVGSTLHLIDIHVAIAVALIGIIALLISALGYMFGSKLGRLFGERGEMLGGIVLIIIGITFLL